MSCEHCRDLELELAVVRAERDMLLTQREGVREWLGDSLLKGSPMGVSDRIEDMADALVAKYPEQKIIAIKELRNSAPALPGHVTLGLKEAKDAIDAAVMRRDLLLRERARANLAKPTF